MKKLFALPLAAFVFAACSESTAPENIADLSPSHAKPVPPPPPPTVTGTLIDHTFTFDEIGAAVGAEGANWGTDSPIGGVSASSSSTVAAPSGERFLGRFAEVTTQAVLSMPAGTAEYSLTFDLYIIGSWDGRGKQAQSGTFEGNFFTIAYRCNGAAGEGTPIFQTSFSNQLTVQQDYPNALFQGGYKAGTNSIDKEALEYWRVPLESHTPAFRSFSDVTYRLSYTGPNPCGAGVPLAFVFRTAADPDQQSLYDESWGIDNVIVKADGV